MKALVIGSTVVSLLGAAGGVVAFFHRVGSLPSGEEYCRHLDEMEGVEKQSPDAFRECALEMQTLLDMTPKDDPRAREIRMATVRCVMHSRTLAEDKVCDRVERQAIYRGVWGDLFHHDQ